MPIYFRNTPVSAPFMFDSIGNHWVEEETSHFISMFKKATGMTPLEFRRMH